ncbi:hypothetical protein V8C26DRAFT_70785 [Trichoderma gracile]
MIINPCPHLSALPTRKSRSHQATEQKATLNVCSPQDRCKGERKRRRKSNGKAKTAADREADDSRGSRCVAFQKVRLQGPAWFHVPNFPVSLHPPSTRVVVECTARSGGGALHACSVYGLFMCLFGRRRDPWPCVICRDQRTICQLRSTSEAYRAEACLCMTMRGGEASVGIARLDSFSFRTRCDRAMDFPRDALPVKQQSREGRDARVNKPYFEQAQQGHINMKLSCETRQLLGHVVLFRGVIVLGWQLMTSRDE